MASSLLLWADDSEAILTFGRAALAGRFDVATATNGREALDKIQKLEPAVVILDLSMPELSGEEVLDACRSDPKLVHLPIIVASAEHERAHACLARGADAVLVKPIDAETLLGVVNNALMDAERRRQTAAFAILPVAVGGVRLGIPLAAVRAVIPEVACQELAVGAPYLSEVFEYEGVPVCVLDLATRLAVRPSEPRLERKLVLLDLDRWLLAIRVDRVSDPEELGRAQFTRRQDLGGGEHAPIDRALVGVGSLPEGLLPIVDPAAFFAPAELRALARLIDGSAPQEDA